MSVGLVVTDGRQQAALLIQASDLAIISERCPKQRAAAVRSTYVALLEMIQSGRRWTLKATAERAGVGTGRLKDAMQDLRDLGMLREDADGAMRLASVGSVEALPVLTAPARERATDGMDPALVARAERFCVKHAERIRLATGSVPAQSDVQVAAACRIIGKMDDAVAIMARLDWALAERFYADKVATMKRFAEWWDRICLAYGGASQQAAAQQRRHPRTPVEAKSARVTYSSDVVQITAAT